MSKTSDPWHTTFAAMFGKNLTAQEIHTWQNEILAAFEGKTRPWVGEAADAIRSLADKWPRAAEGQYVPNPTARDIVTEMRKRRREHVDGSTAHLCTLVKSRTDAQGRTQLVARRVAESSMDWQARLKRTTPPDRWSIICEPDSDEQCAEREKYCDENGLAFVRFVPDTRYNVRVG